MIVSGCGRPRLLAAGDVAPQTARTIGAVIIPANGGGTSSVVTPTARTPAPAVGRRSDRRGARGTTGERGPPSCPRRQPIGRDPSPLRLRQLSSGGSAQRLVVDVPYVGVAGRARPGGVHRGRFRPGSTTHPHIVNQPARRPRRLDPLTVLAVAPAATTRPSRRRSFSSGISTPRALRRDTRTTPGDR
jgi:hypothetical protein